MDHIPRKISCDFINAVLNSFYRYESHIGHHFGCYELETHVFLNSEAEKEKSHPLFSGEAVVSVSPCFILSALHLTEYIINVMIHKVFIFTLHRMK